MRFLLMHQTIVQHDAIGRDVLQMYKLLAEHNECFLFREYGVNLDGIQLVDLNHALWLVQDKNCAVLYHHSIHWPTGEQVLCSARGPIIFKYHNITQPNYFAEAPMYWRACVAGREQTYRFVTRFPQACWLTDSLFNLQELGIEGGISCAVVPPFLSTSDANGTVPDEFLLRELVDDRRTHVLFVGRFAPNKGHIFMLRVIASYRKAYGRDIILHIIGKKDEELHEYFNRVIQTARNLNIEDLIDVTGEVTAPEVLSYFLGSDAYLCCSEHEGFCVPIVEAQSLCLPVIARARAAVPETIGSGQILLGENPDAYTAWLHRLRMDADIREQVIDKGRCNYFTRFTNEQISGAFFAALRGFGIPA